MISKSHTIFIVLMLAAGMLFAAGGQEERGGQETVVLVLDWVPNTNHVGAYLADALGYFAEEGLAVDIIQPAESSAETLVALGRAQFGYSYQESVTFARTGEDQLPVRAIAAVIQHNTSGFASPGKLESIADLVGLTYGGWGSPVETAMLKTLLEAEGASLDDINILSTGTVDFFSATERGVNFSWVFEGWTMVEAEQRGVELSYLDLADINEVFDYYTPVIISSEEMLQNNPDLARGFMRALSRGYEYAVENPREAAAILVNAVPEIPLELAEASLIFLAGEFIADAPRWGEMRSLVWARYADWLFENELIPRPLNAQDSFSNEYLPRP